MKTLPKEPADCRQAKRPEVRLWPLGQTPWLAVLLSHLALSALVLGPPPCLRAQASGPEEYTFTTLAGPPESPGAIDGTGSAARFYNPSGVAVDSAGNVYVADAYNHTIRMVTPDGVVTTLAGLAGESGNADGQSSAARFNYPWGVAVDSAGNVYVADSVNSTIRKVTSDGAVTTFAGLAGSRGSADGTGSVARFNSPRGVAVDSAGNVYVADTWDHTIRKVTPDGVVATLAGLAGSPGSDDGRGSAARFGGGGLFELGPSAVAVDKAGNVFVADARTIRMVTPDGVVTTLAGLAKSWGSTDGTGDAVRFGPGDLGYTPPSGVAVDSTGKLYVADSGNHTIRVGTPEPCPDRPTIDPPIAPAGLTRQLDTRPQTAVAWQWSWIRRPAASTAELSDPNVRNPTFTPDVADLYIFRLKATNAVGAISIRMLELAAVPADVAVLDSPQRLPDGSFQLALIGQTNQGYTLQVSTNLSAWTDWTNVIPASFSTPFTVPPAAHDSQRFYRARTP